MSVDRERREQLRALAEACEKQTIEIVIPADQSQRSQVWTTRNGALYLDACDPSTVIALLDAADRADRLAAALDAQHHAKDDWGLCTACRDSSGARSVRYPCSVAAVLAEHGDAT